MTTALLSTMIMKIAVKFKMLPARADQHQLKYLLSKTPNEKETRNRADNYKTRKRNKALRPLVSFTKSPSKTTYFSVQILINLLLVRTFHRHARIQTQTSIQELSME